ncbi:glycosyltransferase [Tellurirhabdus rosea]|uniref:glycosyltransferase n=1 Tax=Tellurirhabdus rosea TaxID=2674997 RepID=UPI00225C41AD|nr:glycosyltransferase [Tellurirhabdus rosea]
MKIVHCFFTMKVGGSQTLAIDMMNIMCINHDVSLIIVNNDWSPILLEQLDPTIKIYKINRKISSKNPLPIIKLNLLIQKLNPDVIHCHELKLVNLFINSRHKLIYTIHDVNIPTKLLFRYRSIIAISDAVAFDVKKRSRLSPNIIYNGINFNQFIKKKSYLISPPTPIKLVQLGRLVHKHKGQDLLLKAFASLKNNNRNLHITLDFIGAGESEVYLKTLAKNLGVENEVTFIGEKSRTWIKNNLCNYDILVQPSTYEGFGLTVIEGLAAGLPIIASDIDGPAEIIRGLNACKTFLSKDIKSLEECLLTVISYYNDNFIESEMVGAYDSAAEKYSIENTVDQYLTLYSSI